MQVPKENKNHSEADRTEDLGSHTPPSVQSEHEETEVGKICVGEENSLSGNAEAVSLLCLIYRLTHTCQLVLPP